MTVMCDEMAGITEFADSTYGLLPLPYFPPPLSHFLLLSRKFFQCCVSY